MAPLVSILIPAFNAERWLADALRSCLAQTWPRTEIIVVNDGSQDRTLEVARAFESRSVKVVTQPNRGAPAARNRALALAQGSFIQWLDADDLLDPGKIAAQMRAAAERNDPRVLLSAPFGVFYQRPERASFVKTALWRDLSPVDYFITRFTQNVYLQTAAWLVSRELTEAAGPWCDDHSPDDDGEYFCRVVSKSAGIKFVEQALSYYRVGISGSLHGSRSDQALTALFESKVKCIRYLLLLENSARTRAASVRLLQDWMPSFYPEQPGLIARSQELARTLGGEARLHLKWKYRPVAWLFGYPNAVKLNRTLIALRTRAASTWEAMTSRCCAGPSSVNRARDRQIQIRFGG